MGGQLRLRSL